MIFKRIFLKIFILSVILLLLKTAAAEDSYPKAKTLELNWMHYHYDYKEDITPPAKSKEIGWLDGLSLMFIYRGIDVISSAPVTPFYERLLFESTSAPTTYDGSIYNSATGETSPHKDTTYNTFLRIEGDLGYTLRLSKPCDFTPYSGLGWRSWNRDLGNGDGAYRELYNWMYLPLGLRFNYRINNVLNAALDASYRLMFSGNMQVYFSELDSHFNDPIVILGNKPGYKIEAPLSFYFFTLTPWYEYSAIGKSNNADWLYRYEGVNYKYAEIYEPASDTHQYGLNLGIQYKF